jgi:hypothetical protein
VLGHANGAHLNVVATLGAWAALRRARGDTILPRPEASVGLGMSFADQLCDVRLLSAAMGWAAERSAVGGDSSGEGGEVEIFNIDNGDVASWEVSRASSIHAVQPASC